MSMETEVIPPLSAPPAQKPRALGTLWIISAGCIFLVVFTAWLVYTPADGKFTWLNPDRVMNPSAPDALTKLKDQFLKFTSPVWNYFTRNKKQVSTEVGVLTMTSAAAEKMQLGEPNSTNEYGMRAWILSPEQLTAFKQLMKTTPGVIRTSNSGIVTLEGMECRIVVGLPVSGGSPSGTPSIHGSITINLVAKLRGRSFNTTMGAVCADWVAASWPGSSNIKTNFSFACRVLIPNAGGLVVECGKGTNTDEIHNWLTLSPTAIAPDGAPLKLR